MTKYLLVYLTQTAINNHYKVNIESILNSKGIALTNDHDSSQSNVLIILKMSTENRAENDLTDCNYNEI